MRFYAAIAHIHALLGRYYMTFLVVRFIRIMCISVDVISTFVCVM